jgi:hypothetical protein
MSSFFFLNWCLFKTFLKFVYHLSPLTTATSASFSLIYLDLELEQVSYYRYYQIGPFFNPSRTQAYFFQQCWNHTRTAGIIMLVTKNICIYNLIQLLFRNFLTVCPKLEHLLLDLGGVCYSPEIVESLFEVASRRAAFHNLQSLGLEIYGDFSQSSSFIFTNFKRFLASVPASFKVYFWREDYLLLYTVFIRTKWACVFKFTVRNSWRNNFLNKILLQEICLYIIKFLFFYILDFINEKFRITILFRNELILNEVYNIYIFVLRIFYLSLIIIHRLTIKLGHMCDNSIQKWRLQVLLRKAQGSSHLPRHGRVVGRP